MISFLDIVFNMSAIEYPTDSLSADHELFVTATYSMKVLCENPPGYDTDSIMVFRTVRNKNFTGVIFPKEKGVGLGASPTRYTLSAYEVSKTEQVIKHNIKRLNKLLKKRRHFRLKGEQIPNLSYNDLNDFFRHYIGYKLKNGDIIVLIIFERNQFGDYLLEELPTWTDANESYNYFGIDVNLTRKKIMLPKGFVYLFDTNVSSNEFIRCI